MEITIRFRPRADTLFQLPISNSDMPEITDKKQLKPPHSVPKWNSINQILIHSAKGSIRAGLMATSIKSLVAIAIKFARTKRLSMQIIMDAVHASAGFTKMIASYTFIWKFITNALHFRTGKVEKRNGFIGGCLASFGMLFETRENRIGYAQQFFMRAMQVLLLIGRKERVKTS